MKIKVSKVISGTNAVSIQKGELLFNQIEKASPNEKVELDFEGISVFATPFFNASIAKYLKDLTINELRNKLEIINMNKQGLSTLNHVIHNAIDYYGNKDLNSSISKHTKTID